MKENPELKMPQLAKKAGKLWKEMPQEDKQVYKWHENMILSMSVNTGNILGRVGRHV